MDIFIVRHADPIYDPDGLTERGFKEADALVPRMEAWKVSQIHSSPSTRARLTATPTAKALNLPIGEIPWLMELSDYKIQQDGQEFTVWDINGDAVRSGSTLPTMDDWWKHPLLANIGIKERWDEFRGYMDEFLGNLGYERQGGVYKVHKSSQERVAFFCHGGTTLFLLSHLLEIPPTLTWCGNYIWPSSVSRIHFDELTPGTAVPRALHVSDVSHLIAAGLEPNPRGRGSGTIEEYR